MGIERYMCVTRRGVAVLAAILAAAQAQATTLWLEGESAQDREVVAKITSPLLIKDDSAASNGSYIEVEPGRNSREAMPATSGVATYSFVVETRSTFRLWARVITPTPSDDSFWVRMDGAAPIRWNDATPGEAWHWSRVRADGAASPASFTLGAGTHTLRIGYREDGARLDVLVVTDDPTFDPNASLAGPPETPVLRTTSEESTALHVMMSWNAVPGAESYAILRDGETIVTDFRGHVFFDELRLGSGCYEVVAVASTGTSPRPPFCQNVTAEDFLQRRGLGDMSLTPPMATSGGRLVTSPGTANSLNAPPAQGRARYDFRIATSSLIKVWALVNAPDPSRDSFWVRLDDGPWIKWNNIPGPFLCEDVHDSDNGGEDVFFHVLPGSHRLEFAYRETGTTLSNLALAEFENEPCQD